MGGRVKQGPNEADNGRAGGEETGRGRRRVRGEESGDGWSKKAVRGGEARGRKHREEGVI